MDGLLAFRSGIQAESRAEGCLQATFRRGARMRRPRRDPAAGGRGDELDKDWYDRVTGRDDPSQPSRDPRDPRDSRDPRDQQVPQQQRDVPRPPVTQPQRQDDRYRDPRDQPYAEPARRPGY